MNKFFDHELIDWDVSNDDTQINGEDLDILPEEVEKTKAKDDEVMPMANEVKILKDTCDGYYQHLIGEVVTVVEGTELDEGMIFYRVVGDPIIDEELVYCGDVEVLSYYEIDKRFA